MCQKGCYPMADVFWLAVLFHEVGLEALESKIKRAGGRAVEPQLAPPCGRLRTDPEGGVGGESYSQWGSAHRANHFHTPGHIPFESERIEATLLPLEPLLGLREHLVAG